MVEIFDSVVIFNGVCVVDNIVNLDFFGFIVIYVKDGKVVLLV